MKKAGTEESMEIMGPMMENIGVAKAQSMMKVIPKLEDNALGFAAWTNTWEELLGIEGHIAESSPERVVKIITKCPLAEEGVSPVMCDLLACSLKGAGSVISPDFFFFNTHMKTRGDDKCRWVIERKK
jgi:predicted hydrocarbon binding protein